MTALLALLALSGAEGLLAGAEARLEAAGVRINDVLHTGALLELREGALVSGRVVEPLMAALRVDVGNGLVLTLEPGVRVTKEVDGLRLSAHAPARLKMSTLTESWESVRVRRTSTGWSLDGQALAGEIGVSLQGQPQQPQDPDAASRRMEEAARKMRESSQRVRPPQRRRVFTGADPFVPGAAADSESLRQLIEISPAG